MSIAGRGWQRGVRDWFPVVLILVAYLVLHALATTLTPHAHVDPQLGFDEWVFGGTAPTVRLQRELWTPGDPHWYDYLAWLVYLSHFVVTLTVAIVLWVRAYPMFRRFRALILTVTFAGFVTYVLYPAIPPWLASRRGDMPHTVRIVRAMWLELGLSDVAAVFGEKSKYAFPVGRAARRSTRRGRSCCSCSSGRSPGAGASCSSRTRSRWRSPSCTPPTTSCSTSSSAGRT